MMGNAEQFMAILISEKIAERLKNRTFKEKEAIYEKVVVGLCCASRRWRMWHCTIDTI